MGLSTHVLDTMHGCPAAGMAVQLYTTQGDSSTLLKRFVTNSDGRSDGLLVDTASLQVGTYRLTFDVEGYFKARGVVLPEPVPKVTTGAGAAGAGAVDTAVDAAVGAAVDAPSLPHPAATLIGRRSNNQ